MEDRDEEKEVLCHVTLISPLNLPEKLNFFTGHVTSGHGTSILPAKFMGKLDLHLGHVTTICPRYLAKKLNRCLSRKTELSR